MKATSQSLPGPLELVIHPRRYWNRWTRLYSQWEFWVLGVIVIGSYATLNTTRALPASWLDYSATAKAAVTAAIMIPMPYVLASKLKRRHGRPDWFERTMQRISTFTGRPQIVASLLGTSILCLLLPIYVSPDGNGSLAGWLIIWEHPWATVIPVLYLVSAMLVLRDLFEWRWVAFFWILGGYAGLFFVTLSYTNIDVDIDPAYSWAFFIAWILPIVSMILCALPFRRSA